MDSPDVGVWLLRHGLILLLLGMASAYCLVKHPGIYVTPRLALSSHMLGAIGGLLLIALGLMTDRISLSTTALTIAFFLSVYGGYANWLAAVLGAIFGTGTMTPLASEGKIGAPWQEKLVNALLNTCGPASFAGVAMFLFGLRRV